MIHVSDEMTLSFSYGKRIKFSCTGFVDLCADHLKKAPMSGEFSCPGDGGDAACLGTTHPYSYV